MYKRKLQETLDDYLRAASRLSESTKLEVYDDIIYDGVIQRFEFTFELSWKLMKVYLEYTGISGIRSPRGAIREAFSVGLIEHGDQWIDMMIDRNKASHLYNENEARFIYEKIKNTYDNLLNTFGTDMEKRIVVI